MRPTKLTLHVYQVGFGDCFLLTFHYPNTKRHVLIDYGTTELADGVPKNQMQFIAKDIAATCGDKLHAVVVSHRHKDHISGFATNASGNGTGDRIRALKPDVVVQPWTEDPRAKKDAKKPTRTPSDRAAIAALDAMHPLTEAIFTEAMRGMHSAATPRERALYRQLTMEGMENIGNEPAVRNLATLGKRRVYVFAGSASGLANILPGVKITVLGPPTVAQTATVLKQRDEDQTEFWMLRALQSLGLALLIKAPRGIFKGRAAKDGPLPPSVRWFVPRLRNMRAAELLQIVRIMDDAMNNTSVILLFEVGKQKLLFPGDAQIENWEFALSQPKLKKLLTGVTVYKVGHHGSRNATPKTLWNGFKKRSTTPSASRLRTFMSTKAGKHGDHPETAVPRSTLVDELKAKSTFFTTQDLTQPGQNLKATFDIPL
jgi:hypothetical protein